MLRGFDDVHLFHLIHAAVAGNAAHAARHVRTVVEVHVVGQGVHFNPRDRCFLRERLANGQQLAARRGNLLVAIHARGRRRNGGESGPLHRGVAIATVHAQLAGMQRMAERNGLLRGIAHPPRFRRTAVIEHGHDIHGSGDQHRPRPRASGGRAIPGVLFQSSCVARQSKFTCTKVNERTKSTG